MIRDSDDDDPIRDDEWPDETDHDSDSVDVVPCSSCGKMVADGTQQCPHCGDWIVTRVSERGGWRRWTWSVVAVLVMLMIGWWWR